MAANTVRSTVPKPHHGRGTIPLNRSFKGIGLIRMASGTKDPRTFQRLMLALDSLYQVGNTGMLEELRDGTIAPMKLLSIVTNRGARDIGDLRTSEPLEEAVTGWVQRHKIADATRKSYGDTLKQFYKIVPPVAKVREIPRLLRTYRDQCESRGIPYTATMTRRILLSFASHTYGQSSDLYQQIHDVNPPASDEKLKNDAISVKEIRRLMECLPAHHANSAWTMCLTGLRVSEFFETSPTRWTIEKDAIAVLGSKTKSANRNLFRAANVEKPTGGELAFRRALSKALKDKRLKNLSHVTPHTFRKCFSLWMARAGIIRMHRDSYRGHSSQSMAELYEGADVTPYIKADGKKFSAYLKKEQADPKKRTAKKAPDVAA